MHSICRFFAAINHAFLSLSPLLFPVFLSAQPADQTIFAEALAKEWRLELSNDVIADLQATGQIYRGSFSLGFTVDSFAGKILPSRILPAANFKALRFALHPGTATVIKKGSPTSKIAFQSRTNERWEIFAMEADGKNLENLTNFPASDRGPAFSPNGSLIAFHSDRDGNFEIYIMDADGKNPLNLSRHDKIDAFPAFSPDGSKIAFHSNRDGNLDIHLMNADGSGVSNLTNHPAFDWFPHWSPDGSKIAFHSNREGNFEIYIMDVDGKNPLRLTDHPARDQWAVFSPDGSSIAFSSQRDGPSEIYTVDTRGNNLKNLSRSPANDYAPAFSPDGGKIAFYSDRDGNTEIYVMDVKGSNQIRLTQRPDEDHFPTWLPTVTPGAILLDLGLAINDVTLRLVGINLLAGAVDIEQREWQVVEIPLQYFGPLESIESIQFSGNLRGTFFLDDIQLIAEPLAPTTILETQIPRLPQQFILEQNFPNPFNSSTSIRFGLPTAGPVDLSIYNLLGHKVLTLVQEPKPAGVHTLTWEDINLASGTYLYLLRASSHQKTRKLILAK